MSVTTTRVRKSVAAGQETQTGMLVFVISDADDSNIRVYTVTPGSVRYDTAVRILRSNGVLELVTPKGTFTRSPRGDLAWAGLPLTSVTDNYIFSDSGPKLTYRKK